VNIRKLPRAWFSSELPPGRKGRKELASLLEQHLAHRFGPVELIQPLIPPLSIFTLSVRGVDFQMGMGRARRKGPDRSAWWVAIDPEVSHPPKLSNAALKNYAPGLMLISNEVHYMLTGISGITRLRWGFETGSRKIVQIARSPADLPWHADVLNTVR
jgi:hypothetical protein